jgi:TadE-like protein
MKRFRRDQSAQALLEIAFLLPMLGVLVMGTADYSRAIYDTQVMTNLAGEGSSLASRGTTLADTVTAVAADSDIDLADLGCVVVSSVTSPSAGSYQLTGQAISGTCNIGSSYVGCYPVGGKCTSTAANLPTSVQNVLAANSIYTIYVTEVFYKFNSATSVGKILTSVLPSQLYSVAYY